MGIRSMPWNEWFEVSCGVILPSVTTRSISDHLLHMYRDSSSTINLKTTIVFASIVYEHEVTVWSRSYPPRQVWSMEDAMLVNSFPLTIVFGSD